MVGTNGAGVLSWVTAPPATVSVDAPIFGNGAATGTPPGTGPLGLTMATAAQILAGTDDVYPIDSEGLRSQFGQAVTAANMGTTAATVVPAIAELGQRIAALSGAIIVVGSYNATTHQILNPRPPASLPPYSLVSGGALPAMPNAAMRGWLWLVSTAGTAVAPAPAVPMAVGDWVVSNGVDYVHLSMGLSSINALNVISTPPGAEPSLTNVQLFLNWLYNNPVRDLNTDGLSVLGDGTGTLPTDPTALHVGTVDAGVYA